jgi:hypothetical protein
MLKTEILSATKMAGRIIEACLALSTFGGSLVEGFAIPRQKMLLYNCSCVPKFGRYSSDISQTAPRGSLA